MGYIYGTCQGTDKVGSKYDFRVFYEFIEDSDKTSKKQYLKIRNEVRANTVDAYGYTTRATFKSYVNENLIYDHFLALGKGYTGTDWVEIGSTTIELQHNADGSYGNGEYKNQYLLKSRFATNITSSYALTSGRIADTYLQVPEIKVASDVKGSDAEIGGTSNISILNRVNGFTYTLKYQFGVKQGIIEANSTKDVITWTIPTNFYEEIPNSSSGICKITCETFNGTVKLGTTETTINVSVNKEINKPDLSVTCKDINTTTVDLTGSNQKVIKFFSKVQVVATATAKNEATMSAYEMECADGQKKTTATSTFDNVESGKFKITAIDSRGIPATDTKELTLIEYIKLTANAKFERKNPTDGKVKLNVTGIYFNQNFGSKNNTLTCKYRYREKGTTNWSTYTTVTATITNNEYKIVDLELAQTFDYKKQFEFEFVAQDKLMSITKNDANCKIGRGEYLKFINDKAANYNVPLFYKRKRILSVDELYPIGKIEINTSGVNPAQYLHIGTWESYGEGRVLVGVDTSQAEFNAVEKIGGEKEVTLTIDTMPEHTHDMFEIGGNSSHHVVQSEWRTDAMEDGGRGSIISPKGEGKPHNNMPPYITCYMWKRVS